jgi:energy-coupling factor transporter ATP-binding protein EcfA2
MTEPVLSIEGLSITYPKAAKPAIDNLTMHVDAGEFVGVMGANGAGKSTLSLACVGIIPGFTAVEMEGSVDVLEMDTGRVRVEDIAAGGAGIVFQQPDTQLISINVELEVAFAMENRQFPREEMRRRIDEALRLVRLTGYEKHAPDLLSGGQKQSVCIATVLTMDPRLIVLDEPTSQLDPIGSDIVFDALRQLNKEQNIAILIMEHKAELLARYADRIIVLDEGKKVYDGVPEEVFANTEDLLSRGVPVPQVSELAMKLVREFNLPVDIFAVDECVMAPRVSRLLRENRHV